MSRFEKKGLFWVFSHFFLFSFLLWFSYCLNTREQDQCSFFLLQHWRKPIINKFCAVSEPKYFLFFLWHGGVGRPQKKFVCVTNLVLELTVGVVRWNLNLRVLNLLVTENDWDSSLWFWHRIPKTSDWAERFLIFSNETCLPVWENKNTR